VRLSTAEYGTAQGPAAEHGDGEIREVSAGAVCEIFGIDGTTGWLTLRLDLGDAGPLQPRRVELIVGPEQVEPATKPPYQGWDGTLPDPPSGL
jgi:hypothetical protein